jgi:outer membrane protein assembly factor BamA
MPAMKTILAFTLALAAATASAKSFRIERIDVNAAKRIPAAAILSETRLDAGKTYSEEEIEQAVNRVRRLPFVLAASADLKAGSTPDARVLRINVEETSNFNWNVDTSLITRRRGGGGIFAASTGYRFFPGAHGMLGAALAGSNESIIGSNSLRQATLAYDGYGLFGTRAYGGVAASTIFRTSTRHDFNPSAFLGIPLTRTQTIEATASRTTSRLSRNVTGIADPIESSARSTNAGLAWLLQTADDPYFARSGFDAAFGPSWLREELDLPFVLTSTKPPTVVPGRQSQRHFLLNASAAKYWPLRTASAAWGRFDATTTRITGTANGAPFPAARQNLGDLLFGLAHDFNRELGQSSQSRWRVEMGAGYHLDRIAQRTVQSNSGPELEIGAAYRNRFGLFRATIGYVAR